MVELQTALDVFMGKMLGDVGAAMSAPLILLGDRSESIRRFSASALRNRRGWRKQPGSTNAT